MKRSLLILLVCTLLASCSRFQDDKSYQDFLQFTQLKLDKNIVLGDQKVFDPKIVDHETLIDLPYPYLLAGNIHPEIYPHDASYSISLIIDLIKAGKLNTKYQDLSKGMLNDFEFMLNKYGYPLNGNRSYFITRSQANILPTNVLEYYELTNDINWLQTNGLNLAEGVFDYWTQSQAQFEDEFAFHWIANGEGPCEEIIKSSDLHNHYYNTVRTELYNWYLLKNARRPVFARGFDYEKLLDCENKECKLSAFYYKNDRASRVSGYDTNHLYGPFNAFAEEFIPVDHSAKLYKSALNLASIYEILYSQTDIDSKKTAYQNKIIQYQNFATQIKKMIMQKLWDNGSGMFYEYHVPTKKLRTEYPFAGAVYLLWSGIFDLNDEQDVDKLIRLVQFIDHKLEGSKGIFASTLNTGMQWDKPYVWPIHQGIFLKGLLQYSTKLDEHGYTHHANYLKEFAKKIRTKYLLANYQDWERSNGKSIKEKVINKEENLLTGYSIGENYSWNLLTVLYFDEIKI